MNTINADSGFTEVGHTADWSVKVWGPDFTSLLKTAAQAMYALTETRLEMSTPVEVNFTLRAVDEESLMVAFLSELVYYSEMDHLGFNQIELQVEDSRLVAQLTGGEILSQSKEIKAVTYHGLAIRRLQTGLEATLVFDV